MYFIEKIIKLYLDLKSKSKKTQIITTDFDDNYVLEDILTCNHHFLPLDSTKTIFACSKCGYVVKKERLRKKQKK